VVSEKSMTQLSELVDTSSDARLRGFLGAVATLTLPEFPTFQGAVLRRLREPDEDLSALELAFLDTVPGRADAYRCFSRCLARGLRDVLRERLPDRHRALHLAAAEAYGPAALSDPSGECAARYLSHLFEARHWEALGDWMATNRTQQAFVRRLWKAATQELAEGPPLERLARRVAAHYVALGSYEHQDARDAFAVLAASEDVDTRAWTALQRAEGLTLRGRFDQAEALLASIPTPSAPRLLAESALAHAGIARWRGRPDEAARLVRDDVALHLTGAGDDSETRGVCAKAHLWYGLIAKDRGDLAGALAAFDLVSGTDDLMGARLAFQRGDVYMKLGHFERALAALDEAVAAGYRSEALTAEQTRYLARRGTVHRRSGRIASALADFEEAREVLATGHGTDRRAQGALSDETEHAFWLARVDDEAGLALLAAGRYDEAALTFERNVRRFRRHAEVQGIDGTYRTLRSTLRLAVAYGCRGVAQPFRRPFAISSALGADHLDLRHARRLMAHVIERVEAADDHDHLGALHREALLSGSLFAEESDASLDMALLSLEISRYPYQRVQAHAHAAFAALRAERADAADRHLRAADEALQETLAVAPPGEPGDLELAAWLIVMDAVTALLMRDGQDAGERIASALARGELAPHQPMLLRQFGDAVERAELIPAVLASTLADALDLRPMVCDRHPLRFADMLVSQWHRVAGGGRALEGAA
jgi:tetratricopeptide (TPR) repeat protein